MKYLILVMIGLTLTACGSSPQKDQPNIQKALTVCGVDFVIQDNHVFDSNMKEIPIGTYKVESPIPCIYQVLEGSVVLVGYPIN